MLWQTDTPRAPTNIHTHTHTKPLFVVRILTWKQAGLCRHFGLYLRVISCWRSDGHAFEIDSAVSPGNRLEISENQGAFELNILDQDQTVPDI